MKESICQRPGADDYCRLPIFVASESEMVSGRDAFRLATLKRQPQSGKKRGNRAQAIQAVANAIHFHWEPHGRINRTHSTISERSHNVVSNFVDPLACLVKFDIGRRARRTANGFAIHSKDETDQRLRWLKKSNDVRPLITEFRTIDIDEADIIRARIETQLAKPLSIENSGVRFDDGRSLCLFPKSFHGGVIGTR